MFSPAKQRASQSLTLVEEANTAFSKGVLEGSREKLDFLVGSQGWIRHTLDFLKEHKIGKEDADMEGEGSYWAYDEDEDRLVKVGIKAFFKGGEYEVFQCGNDIYNKYLRIYKWLHIKSASDPKVVEFREAYYKGELPTREACETLIVGGKKKDAGGGEKINLKELLEEKDQEIAQLKEEIRTLKAQNRELRLKLRDPETPRKKKKKVSS